MRKIKQLIKAKEIIISLEESEKPLRNILEKIKKMQYSNQYKNVVAKVLILIKNLTIICEFNKY